MDAERVGHRVGDGDRQNASEHDGARMRSGVQPDHQTERGDHTRR